jgi:threonylcarbamoyladenosine tRNA methylthiotransferase MtaB
MRLWREDGLTDSRKSRAPAFAVTTLGCRVNQYESESIAAALAEIGWRPAEAGERADFCIINTCTVTAKAAMQSRQAVRRAVREHGGPVLVATGCAVQVEPGVFEGLEGVHYVVDNTAKHRIHEILENSAGRIPAAPQPYRGKILHMRTLPEPPLPPLGGRARPYLKIQDGCEEFCSYCIVPHTRGPSRSLPPDAAMDRMHELQRNGAKEVVLTGIHLGRYGVDLRPQSSLPDLLERIEREGAMERVRLSSIEPGELSERIIRMAKQNRRLCPHFHIPLQSGDKSVLDRMRRPYSPEFFSALVRFIHREIPDAAVGVDVLAGFPGEDERAFENTCTLLEALPIAYLHVFPFSPRPFTPAARFDGKLPVAVIKERTRRLRGISRAKRGAFYGRQTGRVVEVVLENRRDGASGRLKGVSENYLTVLADASDAYRNTRVWCRLTGPALPQGIAGRVVEPAPL